MATKLPYIPSLKRLLAASYDCGDSGRPGTAADNRVVKIYATPTGWLAEARVEIGHNQGYFELHHTHGPWVSRGNTPEEAVRGLPIPADEVASLRPAMTGVLARVRESQLTWRLLLQWELGQAEKLLDDDDGAKSVKIADECVYFGDAPEAREKLLSRYIACLERRIARIASPLASVSDEEIRAEAIARGILAA